MWRALAFGVTFVLAGLANGSPASSEQRFRHVSGGGLEMAGRQVRCDRVELRLDRGLENLGVAAPDDRLLVLNPLLLSHYSKTVQLFVFHHECGHHRVGASELKADCWAVDRGVRDGWLDRNGLGQVCRSFGDAPATDTHPAGRRRCANLDRCFASVEVAIERERKERTRQTAVAAPRSPPKLVAGPRLVRASTFR